MDHEFQNEQSRTRHIMRMKFLSNLINDKRKDSFDKYLRKLEQLERIQRNISRMR